MTDSTTDPADDALSAEAILRADLLAEAKAFGAFDPDDALTILQRTAPAKLTPENAHAAMRDLRARKPHLFFNVRDVSDADYSRVKRERLASPIPELDFGDVRTMSAADYVKARNKLVSRDYAVTAERAGNTGGSRHRE